MRSPPTDLSDAQVRAAVAAHWSITAQALAYAPVGFGSHHWVLADGGGWRWFVTADAVADTRNRLTQLRIALDTAYALRHQCGLTFVVASHPGLDGRLWSITGRYAIALYPYLERTVDGPASPQQRLAMLTALHGATPQVGHPVSVNDLSIPDRATTEALLDGSPLEAGGHGPYASRITNLLRSHSDPLRAALGAYDRLAASIAAAGRDTWVITHGEPQPSNTMITAAGPVLVDWDTVQRAPAARDVWMLPTPNDYTRITGRQVPVDQMQMYRLRWDLKDLCHYTNWLTHTSHSTADTDRAWTGSVDICRRLSANG
jgi:hypothetical protein